MKIKMLQTQRGSVDGCRVALYEAGTEHDLAATAGERDLARAFVDAGFASVVDGPADAPDALVSVDVAPADDTASAPAAQGRSRRKK